MPVKKRGEFYSFEFWMNGRYYSGTFNGKKGLKPCKDKNEARDRVAILRQQIRDGKHPDRKRGELTDFATFVDQVYLPFAKAHHLSYRHAEFRCEMLKKHFSGKRFDEITPMVVVRFIDKRLESKTVRKEVLTDGMKVSKERSPTTVNKEVTLLSSIFRMAIRERITTHNPCSELSKTVRDRIPARYERERRLSPEEEQKLFDIGLQGRRGHLYDITEVALLTGMRKGELLKLEPEHVNLGATVKTFVINRKKFDVLPNCLIVTKPKNRRPRVIPMSRRVRQRLEALCNDVTRGKYVFASARTGGRITDIKRGWKSACEAAGIDDLLFHDLRHEWSSRAAGLGVRWHVRRDILGHSPGSMTGKYTHASPEEKEQAMELVENFKGTELPGRTKWQDKIAGSGPSSLSQHAASA